MRLTNCTTSIAKDDDGAMCTYADLITLLVNTLPKGTTLQQMRVANAIVEKCELADRDPAQLEFNAEETLRIKTQLAEHVWGANHEDIVAFADAVAEADR